MNLSQKVTVAKAVFSQEVDGEMVLLDMNSENYFGLDETGSAIWQAMQKTGSLQEVYEKMLVQYEVEPEVLQQDILNFVEKLIEVGVYTLVS